MLVGGAMSVSVKPLGSAAPSISIAEINCPDWVLPIDRSALSISRPAGGAIVIGGQPSRPP